MKTYQAQSPCNEDWNELHPSVIRWNDHSQGPVEKYEMNDDLQSIPVWMTETRRSGEKRLKVREGKKEK